MLCVGVYDICLKAAVDMDWTAPTPVDIPDLELDCPHTDLLGYGHSHDLSLDMVRTHVVGQDLDASLLLITERFAPREKTGARVLARSNARCCH